jgi:hypothetical protein
MTKRDHLLLVVCFTSAHCMMSSTVTPWKTCTKSAWSCVCVCVCWCVCVCECVSVCVCVCGGGYLDMLLDSDTTYIHTYIHTHTHTYTYTYIHTCISASSGIVTCFLIVNSPSCTLISVFTANVVVSLWVMGVVGEGMG